jgi:hypothetical protein
MAGILTVQTIQGPTSGANANKVIIPAGQTLSVADGVQASDMPAGSVIQVVQTVSYATESTTTSAFTEISSLTTSITPKFDTSKILVRVFINFSCQSNSYPAFDLYRDTTAISRPSASGTGVKTSFGTFAPVADNPALRMIQAQHEFLDSPATASSVSYSVKQSMQRSNNYQFKLNSSITISDDNQYYRTSSTMTLMEIAQ